MPRSLHFTPFIIASFGLHLLLVAAAIYMANRPDLSLPTLTPVNIVNLPRKDVQRLPPVDTRPLSPQITPAVPARPIPEQIARPQSLPGPRHLGTAPDITLPQTAPPRGRLDGSDKGAANSGKTDIGFPQAGKGPLPFLSQADIDQLARKGMPEKKQGDDSVTLDTNEFKFISYNRWLEVKINKVFTYPELAKMSGLQGLVFVKIDILKDGSLGDIDILQSSGYKILDDAVVRAIQEAAPFQPLPDSWNMNRYSIRGVAIFYLGSAYIR